MKGGWSLHLLPDTNTWKVQLHNCKGDLGNCGTSSYTKLCSQIQHMFSQCSSLAERAPMAGGRQQAASSMSRVLQRVAAMPKQVAHYLEIARHLEIGKFTQLEI